LDAYLQIAKRVLETERRPLSPRTILNAAYQNGLVPVHLHGKTQHKTLQARISEDIVSRRETSLFYRTQPGKFFLRRFLTDETVPEDFRLEFPTRRRIRELVRGPALALEYTDLEKVAERDVPISQKKILSLLSSDRFRYGDPREKRENLVFLRSFVCLVREQTVLSYRAGRYREDRDSFLLRRSVGFSTLVDMEDRTLFNLSDFGVVESGVKATRIDLDIPEPLRTEPLSAKLGYFLWPSVSDGRSDLLAVIHFECPRWFEPLKRRLALNDLSWLDISNPVNDIDDFDPWSKLILLAHFKSYAHMDSKLDTDPSNPRQIECRVPQVTD
jgi:HB1/ASXL restriction endonuclease-like protein with HTH domain